MMCVQRERERGVSVRQRARERKKRKVRAVSPELWDSYEEGRTTETPFRSCRPMPRFSGLLWLVLGTLVCSTYHKMLLFTKSCPQTFNPLWPRRIASLQPTITHDARWPGWQVIIGIEVHAQIKSRAKLFSGQSSTVRAFISLIILLKPSSALLDTWSVDPSHPPNTFVSPYDAAFPGSLPVIVTLPAHFTR